MSVFSVRAHMAICALSRANASAVASPIPWLDAATITPRPFSPKSIPSSGLFLVFFRQLSGVHQRRRARLDVILLKADFDPPPQLARHAKLLARADLHQHQVIHLTPTHPLNAGDLRLRHHIILESGIT